MRIESNKEIIFTKITEVILSFKLSSVQFWKDYKSIRSIQIEI